MADFKKVRGDKTTRIDEQSGNLALVLEERVKIDLWGGGPGGLPLVVDADDRQIVEVSDEPTAYNKPSSLTTYQVTGMRSGTTRVTARLLGQSYANVGLRREAWMTAPIWASLQVIVFGSEYQQGGGTWGHMKYGSMKPAWKNVKWTNMAQAGCGPTSLAEVLDYLDRLSPSAPRGPVSYVGITPKETMDYASRYGRSADKKGLPAGTSGKIMMDNISRWWPDFKARTVNGLSDAKRLLRSYQPIVFLAKNTVTWKYTRHGKRQHTWPGHFMVVLGYEGNGDPFWISDPSHFQSKFISADELKKCAMWVVTRQADDGLSCKADP